MKTIFYSSESRGHQFHGWLDAHHTFSFANYYDPKRVHFGLLRVLNDDIVKGGEGFGTHPHDNMEIVTIPLYGALAHKDSMGHAEVIQSGEVQVMSAGTGVTHSEYNANEEEDVNLFQIWIFPDKENVKPRYEQKRFDFEKNSLVQVVSPEEVEGNLWLHQQAWFSMGVFADNYEFNYEIKKKGNGIFAMVVEGEFQIGDQILTKRDALGIWDIDNINIISTSDNSKILLIDVPMS